ncbi:MAG: MBOAT family protein [Bacteroidales bacterium]|nr:MBOAT family protein [Bacteroidales bacterium]
MTIIDYIQEVFIYNPTKPLIFTRFYFWMFFAIVLTFYSLVYKKRNRTMRSAYLFAVSLFFYYKSSGLFFFILLFSTVTDYYIGKAIYDSNKLLIKRILITLSLIVNLSLLVYFKYSYFLTLSINEMFNTNFEVINYMALWANEATGSHFEVDKILLPVGISFYTFQTISYSIDVYRGEVKPVNNIIDFGFYVSFFPQLVAGPIVRAAQFIPQMYEDYKLSKAEFGLALFWIMKGLVKKIFIGDYIAVNFVDRVFSAPLSYSGFENLAALFGYSLQVYMDFAGYTDIAIGVALLLGFRLPKNFNSPYKAQNVGDFWKRWHISLSTWLKDYLYIPMGGNRGGSVFSYIMLTIILLFVTLLTGVWWLFPIFYIVGIVVALFMRKSEAFAKHINTNINLMLTMIIGGLWHGASWQFIIWGGLNGLGLVVYKFWRKISPWENSNTTIAVVWKIALTFSFITFTRVFFRSESMEIVNGMLHQIGLLFPSFSDFSNVVNNNDTVVFIQQWGLIPEILIAYKWVFIIMLIGFVFHWLPYSLKDSYRNWYINLNFYLKALIFALVVFIVYQSISSEMVAFIYFQF